MSAGTVTPTPPVASTTLRTRFGSPPSWVGGVVGVVVIVVLWWIASRTLFTASGAIPGPGAVLAKVGSATTWSAIADPDPVPSRAPPRSLTTTQAPSPASVSAY